MVTHYLTNRTKTFSGFNRFSKFVLIGNNIDGYVNVKVIEFASFQEAINELPGIFRNLEFGGEWNLSFYQVPDNFSIKHMYGYYKVPRKGKKVFEFSYMEAGGSVEIYLSPALIHITCITKDIEEKWDEDTDHWDFDIFEEYHTTFLKEDLDRKSYQNEDYPGNITVLHEEIWK